MLNEDDVRRLLLQRAETKNLDYKRTFNWVAATHDDKCEITKDILAMANTQDGGQLIFGVDDGTFDFVGMDEQELQSFDSTRVNDFLRRFSDPYLACTVYKFTIDNKHTVVIEVPEFSEVPILCRADANSANAPRRTILKRGGLYVRTERPSSELVSSADEMRDVIGRASRKKREDLIRTIEALMTGAPAEPRVDAQRAFDAELEDAEAFFAANLPADFNNQGHWELSAYPSTYIKNRVADQGVLADLLRRSTVALRGWSFPHTQRETASNFARGRQSHTIWERHIEGYRAYTSGLFRWKGAFWENTLVPDQRVLSFISAIYQLTEFFQLCKRYYPGVPDTSGIHAAIKLTDVRGRTLVSMDPRVDLLAQYTSRELEISLPTDLTMAELQTDAETVARRLALRVFRIFNWDDVQDDTIAFWQQKLLTRTY